MKGKRFLAGLLALIMILTCLPVTPVVTAADGFEWLTPDQLTGYADSEFPDCPASSAVDGIVVDGNQWHTNYQDAQMSDDPLVEYSGSTLTGNNNYYIVLAQPMDVDMLSFDLIDRPNAQISLLNVYVSSEEYKEGETLDWGSVVTTGRWDYTGPGHRELELDSVQTNVKSIRLEVKEVTGGAPYNIRCTEIGVHAKASEAPVVEYEFANIDSSKLTAYTESTCVGSSAMNIVDGNLDTQWHTNYPGDEQSEDPMVQGDGSGNLTANNNIYIVLDEAMPVNQVSLYTNYNPNAQILGVKVYVSSEEYTKGAELDWGEVVGSSDWSLLSGPGGRDLPLDEVQYNVKSIRIEVVKVNDMNGGNNIRCSEVYVSVGTPKQGSDEPDVPAVEYSYLTPEEMTGYADSTCLNTWPGRAMDGDIGTNWHTNYPGDEDSGEPIPEGVEAGGVSTLTAHNNYYIVLNENKSVDKLSFYVDNRNGNIKSLNIYVSAEDYGENKDIAWGDMVATADWAQGSGRTEEVVLAEPAGNVKSIRLEITEVYGNTNIRGIEFGVSAGAAQVTPDQPDEPDVPDVPVVEYEFANIDSSKLTAFADSTCLGSSPSRMVDGDQGTQWHTNYAGDEQSDDPLVEGSGGNLTANNNIYIVLDEAMPVNQLSLYTNENPNAQILSVNVYVSAEEYTKGAELDWGEVVGSSDWSLLSGPGGRDLPLDEVQYNVKSIRIEVTKVNGNTNIRCSEVYVSVGTPKEIEYEYGFLTPDELTGYADSTFGTSDPNYALDDDHGTNWHTNYNEPDGGSSDDPFVEGSGGSLTGNNNFYIVLDEKMPVDGLAFWLDERNANIKSLNVYVSAEDYGENKDIDWGESIASGDWGKSGGRMENLAFAEPVMDVKSIRLEITEVHGNTNIRGIDFYVSAGKVATDEPDIPDEPDEPDVPGEKPLFTLAVLADSHIDSGIERWDPPIRPTVTTTVNKMAEEENVDMIAMPGDIVSSHLGSYWGANGTQKKETFDKVKSALMDAVYTATDSGRAVFVGGNHDFRVGMLDFNSAYYNDVMEPTLGALVPATSVEDVSANAFYQTEFPAGTAKDVEHVLAYHYNVNGLDFIMLNPPYQMDENVYYYDQEALEWVANKMADIGDDQTVFLVGHYPLQDGKDGAPDTDAETHRMLKEEILNNYPKAVYIYGHYHTQVVYNDTYERLNTYMSDGTRCDDRDAVTDGFITVSGGSMAYYGDSVNPSGGLGAATPDVVQALLVYVYSDRIVFQMKNYGTRNPGAEEIEPYVVYRDVAAEDDVSGLKDALKEALKASEEAKAIADEAKAAADAALAKAEAAQAAAEEAAKANAENTEAALKAKQAAETAKAEAEAAAQAAAAAQTAAETAAKAAEDANADAAKEALKAAEEAAKAAVSAGTAAAEAEKAAQAQAAAQAAQVKAEAAQAAADAAQAKAEAAEAAAKEAANTAAQDKAAAEAAAQAAADAKTAADAAVKKAQAAAEAAETAKTAADASNKDAAAEAAKAAQAAADAAEQAGVVAKYAADAAEAQAKAQEAQAKAEEAQAAAEEERKKTEAIAEAARIAAELESAKQEALMDIMIFNLTTDTDDLREDQAAVYTQAIVDATAAVTAAQDKAAVEAALAAMEQTVEDIFGLRCAAEEFTDVAEDAWYHDAADFVLNAGMMSGNGNGTFAPEESLTRAMLVQILYNIEGKPEVETDKSFDDVAEADWWYDAVLWAAENGIVNGTGEGIYGPESPVTREQMVTILYRYAGSPEVADAELIFADAADVDDWAVTAVAWAVANGVVKGVGDNRFNPNGNSTRAETAQVMMNYFK